MSDIQTKLEQTIIGTLLNFPDEVDTACAIINSSDFVSEQRGEIFDYVTSNKGTDLLLLAKHFGNRINMADVAGWGEDVYSGQFLKNHCKELREINRKSLLYQEISRELKSLDSTSSDEFVEKVFSALSQFSVGSSSDPVSIESIIIPTVRRLEQRSENRGKITGMPYGWKDLDEATLGIHRGDLIVIAGRPSMGKSAMLSNIIESVCTANYSTQLFSLEMAKERLIERMFAGKEVNYGRIRSGYFKEEDWHNIMKAGSRIRNYKLFIDDTPAITLQQVRYLARKQKQSKDGLDLLAIDYLQLMGMDESKGRVQAIGKISRGLKQLARELDIAVALLSQLSRAVDSRNDKRPMMSDLRDSGEIEQDADVILFPFRPAAYCEKCRDKINDHEHNTDLHQAVAEFIIEKQREGERNVSIPVLWAGKYQKFIRLDENE